MCFSSKEPAPLEMAVPCHLGTETRHEGLLNRMELFFCSKTTKAGDGPHPRSRINTPWGEKDLIGSSWCPAPGTSQPPCSDLWQTLCLLCSSGQSSSRKHWLDSGRAGPSLMHLSPAFTEQCITAGNKLSLAWLQRVQSMLPIPWHLLSKYHSRVYSELSICPVREMAND